MLFHFSVHISIFSFYLNNIMRIIKSRTIALYGCVILNAETKSEIHALGTVTHSM